MIHTGLKSPAQMKIYSAAINASGSSSKNSSMKLSWSVAEMSMVHTVTKPTIVVSWGILQPVKQNKITPTEFPQELIKIFPTLPENHINVTSNIPEAGSLYISILNIQGKVIGIVKNEVPEGKVNIQVPVQNLGKGFYFLKVEFMQSSGQKKYNTISKFIKL
jgi:hypothetical protein